jgi:FkbM family methyltransferase
MSNAVRSLAPRCASPCPNSFKRRSTFFGIWEPGISDYIKAALRPRDTFVDIGANVGYHSLLASRSVGPTGRVFAFEASPTIFGMLALNLAANNTTNVAARNVAVSDSCGHVPIFLGDQLGHSTIIATQAERQGAQAEVDIESYPLSELIDTEAVARTRIIKIDVEGAEWLVARGMRRILDRLPPTAEILIEISSDATHELGALPAELLALFAAAGYSVFEIDNHYTVSFYAERRGPHVVPYDGSPFAQKVLSSGELRTLEGVLPVGKQGCR